MADELADEDLVDYEEEDDEGEGAAREGPAPGPAVVPSAATMTENAAQVAAAAAAAAAAAPATPAGEAGGSRDVAGDAPAPAASMEVVREPRKRKVAVRRPVTASADAVRAIDASETAVRMLIKITRGGDSCFPAEGKRDEPYHQKSRQALVAAVTRDGWAVQPVVTSMTYLSPNREPLRLLSYTTSPEAAAASLGNGQWVVAPSVTVQVYGDDGRVWDEQVQAVYGLAEHFLHFPGVNASEFHDPAGPKCVLLHGVARGVHPSWLQPRAVSCFAFCVADSIQATMPLVLCATDEGPDAPTGWEIGVASHEPLVQSTVVGGNLVTTAHGVRVSLVATWTGPGVADKGLLTVPKALPLPARCVHVAGEGEDREIVPASAGGERVDAVDNWVFRGEGDGGWEWRPAEGVQREDGRTIRRPALVRDSVSGQELYVLGGLERVAELGLLGLAVADEPAPVEVRLEERKAKASAAAVQKKPKKDEAVKLTRAQQEVSDLFQLASRQVIQDQYGQSSCKPCAPCHDSVTSELLSTA